MKRTSIAAAVCGALFVLMLGPGIAFGQTYDDPVIVSPSTISMDSKGVWVTVHAAVPFSLVNDATVTLNDIPVEATFADDRGDLVAKFYLNNVRALVESGTKSLTLTLVAVDSSGTVVFSGSDIVRVVDR